MRTIDADALKSALESNPSDFYDYDELIPLIDAQPTISPDESRGVGKWKMWEDYNGTNVYRCSVCGADWDMIDGTPENNDMNYCPNCGARMEVSEDA